MLEKDLYAPIKSHLEAQGFLVKAEVLDCDVFAVMDDKIVIVELKLKLNLEVVLQAVKRQKLGTVVFVAIPSPKRDYFSAHFRDVCHLLRRLELGLLIYYPKDDRVRMEFDAVPLKSRANSKKKQAHLDEFSQRHGDNNVGGSNCTRIMTVYKESALRIAGLLEIYKELKVEEVRNLSGDDKAQRILKNNYYGWFLSTKRGHYSLTGEGEKEVHERRELVDTLIKEVL